MIKHNRSSDATFLQSDFSSPPHRLCHQFSISSKPCVRKLRMGQSLLVKLVFYRSQPWRGKSCTPLSAPFCAYATVINETPGLLSKGKLLPQAKQTRQHPSLDNPLTSVQKWLSATISSQSTGNDLQFVD